MTVTKWNGKPITKPGFYSGVPLETYHSKGICGGPAVSSTNLRTCWLRSPAHMFVTWAENPDAEQRAPSRSMVLGSAAHHLLLGEDNFKTKYIAQPATYRDKVTAKDKPWHNGADYCKAWNEKWLTGGRVPVTMTELKTIVAMSKSLALDPLVNDGLLRGAVECSGFALDQETGLWIKIRPDVIPASAADYVDLKTIHEVTTPALQSAIRSYGYHQQGALIWEVCDQLELPFETFVLMCIETAAPYCARAVPLTEDDLARGRLQNRAMLRKIATCLTQGHWPGPGEGDLRPLPLSHDERARIDERLKHEGMTS
jgi:hypothetical protein